MLIYVMCPACAAPPQNLNLNAPSPQLTSSSYNLLKKSTLINLCASFNGLSVGFISPIYSLRFFMAMSLPGVKPSKSRTNFVMKVMASETVWESPSVRAAGGVCVCVDAC